MNTVLPPATTQGKLPLNRLDRLGRSTCLCWLLLLISVRSEVIEVRSPAEQEVGNFGARVRAISDVTRDGIPELAVTAFHIADSRGSRGAVFILNGRDFSQVSRADPPYPGVGFGDGGSFGWSLTEIPDANGDGVPELVVGAIYDDRPDLTALGYGLAYVISPVSGAILGTLSSPRAQRGGYFGWSVASLPRLELEGGEQAAATRLARMRLLMEAGARHFLMPTLWPPQMNLEIAAAFPKFTAEQVVEFDAEVTEGLKALQREFNLKVYRPDTFLFFMALLENPAAFGVTGPSGAGGPFVCDNGHFTDQVQALMSQ